MGGKKIARAAVLLTLAVALGAQLGAPMPEEGIPYSFEYYDRNVNGVLDEGELSIYVLKKCDRSENGLLVQNEWQSMIADLQQIFRVESTVGDFLYWDIDRNKNLGFEELQEMLVQGGIFALWDENGDKVINKNEISAALYALCDAGGQDAVDRHQWEIFIQ